jgi:RNA polymerase sigma-70 factor (ECF subfamily)
LTDQEPDNGLLDRVVAGDATAFSGLFRRHQPHVFRFALHMTGSSAMADDVVQDVFLAVMRDARRYEAGRATVAAWLCGIARNCVLRRLERERRMTPLDFGAALERVPDGTGPAEPLAGLLRMERIEALRRAVQALPVLYREAVVLCDLQEMPYGDAAEVIGCPVGTVRSRLHRARSMLAARIAAAQASPAAPVSGPAARVTAGEPG